MSAEPAPDRDADARLVLDAGSMARALRRMALEIVERNAPVGPDQLAVVGIYTRGVTVARRLADEIALLEGIRPAEGALDVSMHRDDLRRRPRLTSMQATRLPMDLEARTVVLADDVFFTGRTVRAALDTLAEYGRPARIQLAALVDRGHRELPIRPDYVGKEVLTTPHERVLVRFADVDGEADAVWVGGGDRPA